MKDDSDFGSESEQIMLEIQSIKKENPNDPRLEELWSEYYQECQWEYEEKFGINYADALKKVMK